MKKFECRRFTCKAIIITIFSAAMIFSGLVPALNATDKTEEQKEPLENSENRKPQQVKWLTYQEAVERAKKGRLPIVLVFYNNNCRKCEIMEKKGFNRPDIAEYVNSKFCASKINGEKHPELKKKYRVNVYPAVWFLDQDAKEIDSIIGYVEPDRLFLILKYVGDGEYKNKSFKKYEKENRIK